MATNNRPTNEIRAGMVKALVWQNTTKEGKPFYKVTLERLYKDESGWKSSKSFGASDLADLARAALAAERQLRPVESTTAAVDETSA